MNELTVMINDQSMCFIQSFNETEYGWLNEMEIDKDTENLEKWMGIIIRLKIDVRG